MSVDLTAGIVRILKSDGTTAGTGFVVSDNGLIATCAHVAELCDAGPGDLVRIVFHGSGETQEAKVEPDWWRPPSAEDVAILCLEEPVPEDVVPLPLGSSADAEGRTLSTFGFPEAKPVEGMAGQCDVIGRTTENGFPVLQVRTPEVIQGFSGAPVWDETLQVVIGMVVSVIRMVQTAFIIPVETLRKVCPALRLPDFSPYRGLEVFEAEHAAYYFGREAATRELLEMLSRQDFVAVVGVSGSGKSSLVRAGLEKGLQAWRAPGLVDQPRCLVIPGSTPLLNLVLALARLPGQTPEAVASSFALPPDALAEEGEARRQANETLNARSPHALADALQNHFQSGGLLLIVDQFERLYTECQDEDVRRRFTETLLAAAGDEARVLLALRADFYGLALEHPGLAQAIKKGQVTLLPMNEEELRRAIVEPARALGRTFQPGFAGRLVADVRGRAGDLPLLEFALTELWEQDAGKGVLTLRSYEELGYTTPDGQRFPGVQGAIAQRAEAVWQDLSDEERRTARRVFMGLVTPGPVDERGEQTAEDTGRRAWQTEWDAPAQRVVEKLVAARLLTTGQDPFSGQPTAEVAHEALIRAWPRLQRWVTDYRPFIHWYEHDLAPFLHRWLEGARHPDFLLPESMLERAQHWLAEYPTEISGPPAEYIRASREWQVQEEKRWKKLNEEAAQQRQEAECQLRVAKARQLAAQVVVVRSQRANLLQRSVLLAVESLRRVPTPEGIQALCSGLVLLPRPIARMKYEAKVEAVAFSPDGEWLATANYDGTARVWEVANGHEVARMIHEGAVNAVAFSPDGRRLATGSASGEVFSRSGEARVWEVDTGREVARMAHEGVVKRVAFSPDGRWLATGSASGEFLSRSGEAQVWEVDTGREVARMPHEGAVNAVAFSPDGRRLATGSATGEFPSRPGEAQVWEVDTGREVARMVHEGAVNAVAFSPDGKWLATASDDRTTRVWEIGTGRQVTRMAHEGAVKRVAFSSDGKWLATGSDDRTARVWEVDTGREAARVAHEGAIAFSPDGRRLASASHDRTTRVWEIDAGRKVACMVHEGAVHAVAFSLDGKWLATGSGGRGISRRHKMISKVIGSGEARVWEVDTRREVARIAHEGGVNGVAFSPDRKWLVTAGDDHTARVWEVDTGREVTRMTHEGAVNAVVFSPDGKWLAVGSETRVDGEVSLFTRRSGEARVWEVDTGREVVCMAHEGGVNGVAFSPDGKWLVTGSDDGKVRVWEIDAGREVACMTHEGAVNCVAFSPDGKWLVAGSGDGKVQVWEAASEREVTRIQHEDSVQAVAFSPDGKYLATASDDNTARVWDLSTDQELARLQHEDGVRTASFSPDGRWLATGSWDRTARVRLWRPEDLIAEACSRLTRNLTHKEWQQYIGDEPYRPTCPNLPVPGE